MSDTSARLLSAWRRAGIVSLLTVAVGWSASWLVAWLLTSDDMGFAQISATAGTLVSAAFGAQIEGRAGGDLLVIGGTARGSVHFVPLTLTLLTLTTAAIAFRRTTPGAVLGRDSLAQAVRVSVLVALLLTTVALLSRIDSGGVMVSLDWMSSRDARQVDGDVGAKAWQATLGSLGLCFATLGMTSLLHAQWTHPMALRWQGWLRAPIRGVLIFIFSLPLVGVLGLLMLAGGQQAPTGDPGASTGIGAVLAAVANWGLVVVTLGAFGPAGHTVQGTASGDLDVTLGTFHERLGHWTQFEPGLWAAVPLTLLVLALSARSVVRASAQPHQASGDLARWVGLLAVVMPVLGLLSRLGGDGSAVGQVWGSRGRGELSGTLGVAVIEGSMFVVLAAALVAGLALAFYVRTNRRSVTRAPLSGDSARRTLEVTVAPATRGGSDERIDSPHS